MISVRSAIGEAFESARPGGAGDFHTAFFGRPPEGEADRQMCRRQERPQPLRPFDQADAFGKGFLDAEFPRLFRRLDAEEIEMPDGGRVGGGINLDQGEGRARHLRRAAAGADEAAREAGLAAAQGAGERNHVAAPRPRRKPRRQRLRRALILQGESERRRHIPF